MTVEELRQKWSLDEPYIWEDRWPELQADLEALIATEREACANIAWMGDEPPIVANDDYSAACYRIAREIRARSEA